VSISSTTIRVHLLDDHRRLTRERHAKTGALLQQLLCLLANVVEQDPAGLEGVAAAGRRQEQEQGPAVVGLEITVGDPFRALSGERLER
jgi:hypothetical protein